MCDSKVTLGIAKLHSEVFSLRATSNNSEQTTQIYKQYNTHQGKRGQEGREERENQIGKQNAAVERERECQAERERAHKAIDLAHQHDIMIIGK